MLGWPSVVGPRTHMHVFVKKFLAMGNKDCVSLSLVLVGRWPFLFSQKGTGYPLKGGVCPSFVYLRSMTVEAGMRVCVRVRVWACARVRACVRVRVCVCV